MQHADFGKQTFHYTKGLVLKYLLLLLPLVAAFALALDVYIPVVPDMVRAFETSPDTVQWTLGIFMVTTGLGQLFLGPLSDYIGRRPVVLLSTLLFFVSSIACASASSIAFLIGCRFFQALSACGMLVCAYSIVRDVFDDSRCAMMFSYLNGALGVSPFLGPILGGYIALSFTWRGCFYFLAAYGLLSLLISFFFLKESNPKEKRMHFDTRVWSHYSRLFLHGDFISAALISSTGIGCFFSFFSASPYILQELLDVPLHEYGYYFGTIGLLYFIFSFVAGYIAQKVAVQKIIALGIALLFLCGGSMLAWHFLFGLSSAGLMIPMLFFGIGGALVIGPAGGSAIASFPDIAGCASALLGALQFIVAFTAGSVLMLFEITGTATLAITILIMALIAASAALFRLKST